jgi:adenylate cyclase
MKLNSVLREREKSGLILSVQGHLIAFVIFYCVAVRLDFKFERILTYTLIFSIAIFIHLIFLFHLKRNQYITFIGIAIPSIDTFIIAKLPFLWREFSGIENTPISYLIKTYTFYLISVTMIIINAIPLRPLYVLVSSVSILSLNAFILYLVATDPTTIFTEVWKDTFMSEKVNLKIQFNMLMMIAIIGAIVYFLTKIARQTILKGIQLEKSNSHLERYFSPTVREEIKNAQEDFFKPGGKEQEVVILFSDIRSFTRISESIGAEKTIALLADYQKRMVKILFETQGTLDKFIGDGIFASFGTPIAKKEDNENAINCAIKMQEELMIMNRERSLRNEESIEIGIGIHFGKAIVGNIGSEDRLEYTIIGDTVNTASRVEAMTKELKQKILITEKVFQSIESKTKFVLLGEYELRGKSEKIKLYGYISV